MQPTLALGKLLTRLGKDKEAEVAFDTACATIESIAEALKTDAFVRTFLNAPPVLEAFEVLSLTPPISQPPTSSLTAKTQ